jgi:diguanylate cyclase (GGDEF)-like protein
MDTLGLDWDNEPLTCVDLEILLSELDHYRAQSVRLQRVNDLYGKLAGITDMPTMIETYSIWLAEYVPHEIIGYNNRTRHRKHMYCSSHGPQRRHIIQLADSLLHDDNHDTKQHIEIDGFHCHTWDFKGSDNCGRLLLLRREHKIPADQIELINDSLATLAEPLARTHDFEEICKQARMDSLTGLANRLVFDERIDYMLERARRHKRPLTLVALDLDHFKTVNDTMGHVYGDEVLKLVAATLRDQIRLPDLLVRMGGDEFLLALPDTDQAEARLLCERLCRSIHNLKVRAGNHTLGISSGLAQWEAGMDKLKWMERADDALYQAKKGGRNRVAH